MTFQDSCLPCRQALAGPAASQQAVALSQCSDWHLIDLIWFAPLGWKRGLDKSIA